ncbi:helix-turn-helix domain-containing protein [Kitasatospora sp. NPDC056327]|uniref:helix-turn-helix domain-containing protein n=1 Tax=Kitasatospora sp. NPDC056327 TaxID=3345785 RepID=UPI0035D68076
MGVETDEFAGMLRALKERSGLSYGVLATRLHTGTSTLHRYCNGVAVPADYAPVERFARACGANDRELVELHRCWLVADAARRRETGTAAARQGAAPAGPGPRAVGRSVPPEPAVPEPRSAEPEMAPVAPVAPQPGRSAGARRSGVLLGAVAVVGLAAAVPAVLLYGRGTPEGPPPAAATAAVTTAATTAAPALLPTPAPPPSTGAPAGGVQPGGAPTTAPPATATPPEGAAAPFHVNVLTDNWGSPCGQWFVSPRAPGRVAAPPDTSADVDSWAAAQQGVPGGHLRLQLTAQGADATPVVLHAVYVQVVSRQPAARGNAYMPVSGCGGGLVPAAFAVDLDASAPRAVLRPAGEGTGRATGPDFPYRVSATDPQVLNVDAGTAAQDVTWYLDLVWSSGDRQGRLRVDDHGRPFRTVGIRDSAAYFYDGRRWAPTDPEL